MDDVDLESLAWRAVELAVRRRQDPRLIVATRPSIGGPRGTARLVAGLCNAAAGRRAVAVFGLDGTDIVGLEELPDETWLDMIAARFPGVVPAMAMAIIDADGAAIVVLTAQDPGTPVIATRAGRAVLPWFDGELADRPPTTRPDITDARPPGRLELRSGWLEHTVVCGPVGGAPGDAGRSAGARGVGVWRGVVDLGLALDGTIESLVEATPPDGARGPTAIVDRDVSVTLLADGSTAAVSLDVEIHPTPGEVAVTRTPGGIRIDPLVPVRLYLAAAVPAFVGDPSGDHSPMVRLLVSLRFPGDERLVATMATLRRDDAALALRWIL